MKETETLLAKIADFENLCMAFKECSKGKKQKAGYQNFLFNHGEKLKHIQQELLETKTFNWGGYREFEVTDPKKRTIMAAPFKDRVLHTAIHRVISIPVDKTFGIRTYACRNDMGNRNASLRLWKQLQLLGKNRYCIKLDVKQYFANIDHVILENQITKILNDESMTPLFKSLISSHPKYKKLKCGIPIGNLTSQLFANLYLSEMDKLACNLLEIEFYNDELEQKNFYIRYMDDMVVIAQSKEEAFNCANKLIHYAQENLKLSIPPNKKVILSNDPIPFLGFVLDTDSCRVLSRNKRKLIKKLKRMTKAEACLSDKAMVVQSYTAWKNLDDNMV
jgi:hypothetical protein